MQYSLKRYFVSFISLNNLDNSKLNEKMEAKLNNLINRLEIVTNRLESVGKSSSNHFNTNSFNFTFFFLIANYHN
jgi:hypothetical protein